MILLADLDDSPGAAERQARALSTLKLTRPPGSAFEYSNLNYILLVLLVNADHYGLPPVLAEVGLGVTALLAGQQPAPIQLGFIPWVMRALLLIPLLQIAGVSATLRLLRRWRRDPALRPSRGRIWGLHILLPLIPNLSLAAIPLFLRVRGMLRFLLLFTPDFSWIALEASHRGGPDRAA